MVCKCGVFVTSVDDVLGVVDKIVVFFCFVVSGTVVVWHDSVLFVQHLNLSL